MNSINSKEILAFLPQSPTSPDFKKPPKSFLDRFKGKLICTDPRFSVFKRALPPAPIEDTPSDESPDTCHTTSSSMYLALAKKAGAGYTQSSPDELQDFTISTLEDMRDEFFIFDDTNRYTGVARKSMTPFEMVVTTRKNINIY